MEPKFQSSFIPKGPTAATSPSGTLPRSRPKERNFFSFLAVIIFVLSFILAIGTFGYKMFLSYRITQMTQELDSSWSSLEPEVIKELTMLDNRIISAKGIIGSHTVLTPIFEFLETSTPVSVRFTTFNYDIASGRTTINLKGEARGYTALALQADIFSKSEYFKDVIFSDFILNDKGNVTFSLAATVDPRLISYERKVSGLNVPTPVPVATTTVATTSASTSN